MRLRNPDIILLLVLCAEIILLIGITCDTKQINIETIEDGYPDKSNQVIMYSGFHLSYNTECRQADWTAYILTKKQVQNSVLQRHNSYRADKKSIEYPVLSRNYTNSGFDRGHLVPAEDMSWSEQNLYETFYMTNISPQVPKFNQGVWKKLEYLVRKWAVENQRIYVITAPVLQNVSDSIDGNICIPRWFCKIVVDISRKDDYKAIAFLFPNKNCKNDLCSYRVSIDSLEILTGYDFFCKANREIMDKLEQQTDSEQWF